jgi:hypothetical protein
MADKKGFVGVSQKKSRGTTMKTRGEILGDHGDTIRALEGTGGDPHYVHSCTKATRPVAGFKGNRIFCVTDGNTKGVYLDNGSAITRVARNDITSGSTPPATEEADKLFVRTGATDPGIYHDTGSAVSRVANLNTRVLPRQYYVHNSSENEYTNSGWGDRHVIASVPIGNWIIHFSGDAKTEGTNKFFYYRLLTGSTVILGGETTTHRQEAAGDYYRGFSGMRFINHATAATITLQILGANSTPNGCYVMNSTLWIVEYLAGG